MKVTITDKELRESSEEERAEKLKALVNAARRLVDKDVQGLDAQLTEYETRYGMTTEEMQAHISAGTREETMDICEWLMLARRFDLLVGQRVSDLINI